MEEKGIYIYLFFQSLITWDVFNQIEAKYLHKNMMKIHLKRILFKIKPHNTFMKSDKTNKESFL